MMKLPEPEWKAWLRADKAELHDLIVANDAFKIEDPKEGEQVVPSTTACKAKIAVDGTVDKLKSRTACGGDLDAKSEGGDAWAPTASTRLVRWFAAEAARCASRMKQLDFVGAFLQAAVRGGHFVKLPHLHGKLFPEFKQHCGHPLRL